MNTEKQILQMVKVGNTTYVKAKDLANRTKQNQKRFIDFLLSDSGESMLQQLSLKENVDINKLYNSGHAIGIGEDGIWIHYKLAIEYAEWVSNSFGRQMRDTLEHANNHNFLRKTN